MNLINFNIQRLIQLFGDIFAILFSLTDALRQQMFDLAVIGTEIVLSPGLQSGYTAWQKGGAEFAFSDYPPYQYRLPELTTG